MTLVDPIDDTAAGDDEDHAVCCADHEDPRFGVCLDVQEDAS